MKRRLSLVLLLGIVSAFCTSCIASLGGLWTEIEDESLTIVDYDLSKDYEYPVITGEIRNDHEYTVESVEVQVMWYPQSGDLLGQSKAYIDEVAPGEVVTFAVYGDGIDSSVVSSYMIAASGDRQ